MIAISFFALLQVLVVALVGAATLLFFIQTAAGSLEKYAEIRYGSAGKVAELEKQVEALAKEMKRLKPDDISTRLAAVESKLNIRMF